MTYAIGLALGTLGLTSALVALGLARAARLGDHQLAREEQARKRTWRARLGRTRPA